MALTDIIILVLGIILLALAGGFAAKSSSDLAKNINVTSDPDLSKAKSYMTWCSVISFVGLFFVIIALVLNFVFGEKIFAGRQKLIMGLLVGFIFVLVLIAGILAALGASGIKNSNNYTGRGSDKSAYNYAVAAASVLFVGLGLLFVAYLILLFVRKPKVQEAIKEKLMEAKKQAEKLALAGKAAVMTPEAKALVSPAAAHAPVQGVQPVRAPPVQVVRPYAQPQPGQYDSSAMLSNVLASSLGQPQ